MEPEDEFKLGPTSRLKEEGDISHVVTNISGQKASTRRRLANDQATRTFLEAALDLTTELFEADPADKLPDDDDGLRPTMSYLSRRKVLERARSVRPDLLLTENMLRHRWSLGVALSAHSEGLLTTGEHFPQAVHRVAYEDLKRVLELPSYRFQLLAVASAQADTASSGALVRMYEDLSKVWTSLYSREFERYGLSFRPGISMDDFNILLQATAEGLGMRLLSGVAEPIIDHDRKSSLLGTAAMALFLSLVDPGDGLSVEDATDRALSVQAEKRS